MPKPFTGTGSFGDWVDHFESVAVINEWDDGAKLLWMRVRLVGRVQTAYGRLPTTAKYTWYLTQSYIVRSHNYYIMSPELLLRQYFIGSLLFIALISSHV